MTDRHTDKKKGRKKKMLNGKPEIQPVRTTNTGREVAT